MREGSEYKSYGRGVFLGKIRRVSKSIAVGIFLLSFCLIYNTLVLFRIDEIMLKWNY